MYANSASQLPLGLYRSLGPASLGCKNIFVGDYRIVSDDGLAPTEPTADLVGDESKHPGQQPEVNPLE